VRACLAGIGYFFLRLYDSGADQAIRRCARERHMGWAAGNALALVDTLKPDLS
jgi:hypothetical protein